MIGGVVFGTLSAVLVSLMFSPSYSVKTVVNEGRGKHTPMTWSMYFSDVAETIINVYTPVSKPLSVTV